MDRESLLRHIRRFPDKPGVYLMRNGDGEIIYVGKAKSLKRRVSSYFRHANFASPRLAKLVSLISDISTIRVETEAEALILEARLIKYYQPFFNVELKMTDHYPYIRISSERFPRIDVTRVKADDGALYIGPFVRVGEIRMLLRLAERYMPLRTCSRDLAAAPTRACMRHALGLCLAPCEDPGVEPQYRQRVADLIMLMQGHGADLAASLHARMDAAASRMDFEEAARLRDTIRAIWRVNRQKMTAPGLADDAELDWRPLESLQRSLSLPILPWRIDGFDISHTQGADTVGVAVVFEQGVANKSLYRRFNIETNGEPDDFRSMKETLMRRYKRCIEGDEPLPQLILIDGGPVQLDFALQALNEVGVSGVAAVSLAKREELIFTPGKEDPIELDIHDAGLQLLQRVRDEAHRYAITSHRNIRDKKFSRSALEDIPGLGKSRAASLLTRFGSVRAIAKLTVDELAVVPGVGPVLAERIYDALDIDSD